MDRVAILAEQAVEYHVLEVIWQPGKHVKEIDEALDHVLTTHSYLVSDYHVTSQLMQRGILKTSSYNHHLSAAAYISYQLIAIHK